jgi:hypothetical protein
MDCSDQYVRMCRQAEEIQELWSPADGDVFADELCHVSIVNSPILEHLGKSIKEGKRKDYVWLPRQDQLQELVLLMYERNCYWMFEECYKHLQLPHPTKLESMEQVWLSFVMKERSGKTWNGENWIKLKK